MAPSSRSKSSSAVGRRRLQKEYLSLRKNPVPFITARPEETNIYEWHYVLEGPPDTVYAGGVYHGMLKFPPEYPYAPPSIIMVTKNGRFKTDRRLCLSMSDFHPETWNPMWSVSSILSGLFSFMLDTKPTLGSMETTDGTKRMLAARSLFENTKNPKFRRLFPDFVKRADDIRKDQSAAHPTSSNEATSVAQKAPEHGSLVSTIGVIAASLFLGYFLFL